MSGSQLLGTRPIYTDFNGAIYLEPIWTDFHRIWVVKVFHHALSIFGIQNAEMQKKVYYYHFGTVL